MSETQQDTLSDDETYALSIDVDDLLQLANALEPIRGIVTLHIDHDHVRVTARDLANVYATRVVKPVEAPHARTIVIETEDFVEAVDRLKWAEDRTRLEIDGNSLWIFDGDDHRRFFEEVDLERENAAREEPTIDRLLETVDWDVVAESPAWELRGACWKVSQAADSEVRLMAATNGLFALGDELTFHADQSDPDREFPYSDDVTADVHERPAIVENSACRLTGSFLLDVVDAIPSEGDLEVRFGDHQPFYTFSSEGVETVLAPRKPEEDDDDE